MSINLLNPQLLWLLLLGLVPLLLHLFARTKPPVYQFSSVEFLRKIIRKTMRLKKPQDYLLLALRTLAVLALIGMFLRPLLFSQEKLSGLFQKKNLVVIVDASASMAFVEGAQTRFATACAEASNLLSGLSGRDTANVIWLKSEPEAVFPDEMAANLGYLRDQLRRGTVTTERGANEKAFSLAMRLLEEAEGKREICVVSDFQKETWEEFDPSIPDSIDLIHVKVGDKRAGNRAVIQLSFEPSRPVVGEELSVYAEVKNFSTESIETTVFSEVGESRRSQNISLPAGGSSTATFRHTLNSAGALPVKVSLAEDSFPGDDQRYLSLNVRPYLRVGLVVGDDPETAKLWTRAAQSLRWAVPEFVTPSQLSEDFDVVLLSGAKLDPQIEFPATTKVIALPPSGDALPLWKSMGGKSEDARSVSKVSPDDSPYSIEVASNESPLFELFRSGEHGSLNGLAGSSRLTMSGTAEGDILLQYADGAPALIKLDTNRYWWMSPLTDGPGNFAGRVEFVPFFAELLLADRNTGNRNLNSVDYEPGETLFWNPDEEIAAGKLKLVGSSDEELEFSVGEGNQFSAGPMNAPGIFDWQANSKTVGYSAVNFPVTESNLETLSLEDAESSASVAVQGGDEVRYLRDGMKLWPWLLAAAFLFILLETGVVLWAAKTA